VGEGLGTTMSTVRIPVHPVWSLGMGSGVLLTWGGKSLHRGRVSSEICPARPSTRSGNSPTGRPTHNWLKPRQWHYSRGIPWDESLKSSMAI